MILKALNIALTIFITAALEAVVSPVYISKVCLDKSTSNLWISTKVTDADVCGSFKFHRVYGREDASSPFVLLTQTTTYNINGLGSVVPNNKRWEVFISTHFACNGVDSLISNRSSVDDVAPILFEPDSVSVNYASQHLIAGWSKPPVNDIMGFSLFKENGGTNLLLKDTFSLFYSFPLSDFNPRNFGTVKFSIAAFDSCLNGGILSSYHSPPFLNVQVDPNYYCSRKCSLILTPYKGWTADSFWLYRYNTKTAVWTLIESNGMVTGTTLIIDSNLELDVTYDYFFRCKKVGAAITSSSNRVALQLPSLNKTNPPTIDRVSVIGNAIDISGSSGLLYPSFSYNLEKQNSSGSWISLENSTNTGSSATTKSISYLDVAANASSGYTKYRIIRKDQCSNGFDTSEKHINVWLRENGGRVYWNRYWGWICSSCSNSITYEFKRYNTLSSSWDFIRAFQNFEDTFLIAAGTWQGIQRFRVEARNNTTGLISLSNELLIDLGYDNTTKDTLLIPTAFTPNGLNPVFKISNPAISLGESTLSIYNRWGEKLWYGDGLEGWTGIDLNGNPVGDGLYIYDLTAVYRNKRVVRSGSVLLLK